MANRKEIGDGALRVPSHSITGPEETEDSPPFCLPQFLPPHIGAGRRALRALIPAAENRCVLLYGTQVFII